jgi:hypothetical protein
MNYKIADGERLVILATDEKGNAFQFIKSGADESSIDVSQIKGLTIGEKFNAKVWIEKDDEKENQLTNATIPVDISFTASVDKSTWGTSETCNGVTYYVDSSGKTSAEVAENGIIWLKAESDGKTAWYGLDNSDGVFEIGSRFYVWWLNEDDNPEEFENLDDATKQYVEKNNGKYFRIGVIAPDGTRYGQLEKTVKVYIQLDDKQNIDDLKGLYVSQNANEEVIVTSSDDVAYPEGIGTFAVMNLEHFSKYLIYDTLSDEGKAEFDMLTDELKDEVEKMYEEEAAEEASKAGTESSSTEAKSDTESSQENTESQKGSESSQENTESQKGSESSQENTESQKDKSEADTLDDEEYESLLDTEEETTTTALKTGDQQTFLMSIGVFIIMMLSFGLALKLKRKK